MVSLALVSQLCADLFVQEGTPQTRLTHRGLRGKSVPPTHLGTQMLIYRRNGQKIPKREERIGTASVLVESVKIMYNTIYDP
jgi:hypothetical protein